MLALRLILILLSLPAVAAGEQLCLRVEGDMARSVVVPVEAGAEAALSFRHSIYGSSVEERFVVAEDRLEPSRLRYSEARLAHFYGHDGARLDDGWWLVERKGPAIFSLHLRVSPESSLRLSAGSDAISLSELAEPGGLVRVTVIPCKQSKDAR